MRALEDTLLKNKNFFLMKVKDERTKKDTTYTHICDFRHSKELNMTKVSHVGSR